MYKCQRSLKKKDPIPDMYWGCSVVCHIFQVTVGTIGAGVEVFDKPMTPAEIHRWVRNLNFDFDLDQYHFTSTVFKIEINNRDIKISITTDSLFTLFNSSKKVLFTILPNANKIIILTWFQRPLYKGPAFQRDRRRLATRTDPVLWLTHLCQQVRSLTQLSPFICFLFVTKSYTSKGKSTTSHLRLFKMLKKKKSSKK